MNKQYFKYLFKTTYKQGIVGLVIALFIFPLQTLLNSLATRLVTLTPVGGEPVSLVFYSSSNLDYTFAAVITLLFSIVIPIVLYAGFYSKRYLDNILSLPVKRRQLHLTNYIYGFIVNAIIISVTFLTSMIIVMIKGFPLNFAVALLVLLILLVLAFIVYSLSFLASILASNIVENVLLQFILHLISGLFFFAVLSFIYSSNYGTYPVDNFYPFSVIHTIIEELKDLSINFDKQWISDYDKVKHLINVADEGFYLPVYMYLTPGKFDMKQILEVLPYLIVMVASAGGLTAVGIYLAVIKKPEGAGLPSKEKYSLPTLMPIFFFLLVYYVGVLTLNYSSGYVYLDYNTILTFVFAAIGYFIILFIVKRKIKLNKNDVLIAAGVFVGALVLLLLYTFKENILAEDNIRVYFLP